MASFHSVLQFLILFFSLSFLLCRSSRIQHPLCHNGDRSLLLQFKQSFSFDKFYCDPSIDYSKLSSWKVAHDCCSWDGVDCDDQTGRVIGIDLSSSCLFGSINSSSPLFRLVHLTTLDLSDNNFNLSRIPGEIRSLSKLNHLVLTVSNFSGQIPREVLQLSSLVSLYLGGNSFMLQDPSLKDVAETLTNLTELNLYGVNISSHVPHSLFNLTSLSYLVLANCSLQGQFPQSIFRLPNLRVLGLLLNPTLSGYLPEFPVSSKLEILGLDDTNFSGQLPLSIGNLESLNIFTVSQSHFGGPIPSSIGNLTKLNYFDLSDNYFSGNIPSSFTNLLQLTDLALSHNNFSSSTFHLLGKLTNLQALKLAETNSYGVIPFSFRNLTQLQVLWLPYNYLIGEIPSWMGNLTQLIQLDLSINELRGPIPESVFRLPNLQLLYLQSNNLSGSLKFDSFLQLKYLSKLQLSFNRLSLVSSPYINVTTPKFQLLGLVECNLNEFPAFLRGQNEIEVLMLSNNNIKGHVPNWISSLESLAYLRLTNNSLTGFEQPFSILSLPNFHALSVSNNKFEGPLPIPPPSIVIYDVSQNNFRGEISSLFCNLTSLLALDLSTNNLSGNLPPCLSNLGSSVLVLNLRNNSFSGNVPDALTSGCTLKQMDLSQNKIEGKVPRSLANCSKLEFLNLEENQMNDVFPSWLGILHHLRVLSLRFNKLHGAIGKPLRKSEFDQLQIIDLSHNYFTGKLPVEYFSNWVGMASVDKGQLAYMQATTNFEIPGYAWTLNYKYSIRIVNKGTERAYDRILEFFVVVDLSSNGFEGDIPEILGTLRELQSLNLSNNLLTSHIPSSLGNLTKLEALDLSLNNLSGEIPIQLSFLTFLAIFNVSRNSLTGPVPRGNQFDTFENDSFSANQGLCGHPLSRKCWNTETLPLPPSEDEDEDEDGESPLELNWEIVLIGCGTGLVIGVAFGYAMDTRKYECLVKKKFARWRRSRRN